jgi:hypothetical protein
MARDVVRQPNNEGPALVAGLATSALMLWRVCSTGDGGVVIGHVNDLAALAFKGVLVILALWPVHQGHRTTAIRANRIHRALLIRRISCSSRSTTRDGLAAAKRARLGIGWHVHQRSNQAQQCLLFRALSAAQEFSQFDGGDPTT